MKEYIGRTIDDTIISCEKEKKEPGRLPNVIYILMDDMGFAHLGCYGSDIDTPNIDRLAESGLRYNNFHTTAVCSATRCSLLTGANHHAAGIASLVEYSTGFDNSIGKINPEYGTVAEILKEYGYATFCVGKWHLAGPQTDAGPYDGWPLSKGFDKYYGYLAGDNDQFHTKLVRDNSFLEPEEIALRESKGDYHFSKDAVDTSMKYICYQKNAYPEKPFFLYLALGAMHTPHHAPKEYIDRYKGKFDEGWDKKREKWFCKQKEIGIIPESAELTERNEYVDAWEDLSEEQKKVYVRYMEAYAGFLTYTDEQIGRLIDYIHEIGESENTIIVFMSDNGASAEGGKHGRFNAMKGQDIIGVENDIQFGLEHLDQIGSEYSFNHYPTGWANAGNTPFQWYKIWAYEGGVKDPLIISYPGHIKDENGVRSQYVHVSDVTPTILEVLGITKPEQIKGVPQKPFTGIGIKYTFDDPGAKDRKHVQYYEVMGNRGIYKDGWKAVVNHTFSDSYATDKWELYHVEEDYSEKYDVANQYPDKLEELKEEFLIEAAKNQVFPMVRKAIHASVDNASEAAFGKVIIPERSVSYKGIVVPFEILGSQISLDFASYKVSAEIFRESEETEGVILASGDRFSGLSFYVKDNHIVFVYNYAMERYFCVKSEISLPTGHVTIGYQYRYYEKTEQENRHSEVDLYINEKKC